MSDPGRVARGAQTSFLPRSIRALARRRPRAADSARDIRVRPVILALDVHYEEGADHAVCVGFLTRAAAETTLELVERSATPPAPHEPGRFAQRELPPLLQVIASVRRATDVDAVVVDGHVWLGDDRPGLGAALHRALVVVVVGVAKSAFRGAAALSVYRGKSRQPLFVTAAGIDAARAADLVRSMHGPHRLPTLLRRVDQLARRIAAPDTAKPCAP